METRGPTWREFEDFRDEVRREYRALEQKLWGLVAAVFVLTAGSLFAQFHGAPHVSTDGASIAGAMTTDAVRMLLRLVK